MLNPWFVFGFTSAQTMWEAQLKLLRIFTGAFDQPNVQRKKAVLSTNFGRLRGRNRQSRTKRLPIGVLRLLSLSRS
jgi:hypothetical protein